MKTFRLDVKYLQQATAGE